MHYPSLIGGLIFFMFLGYLGSLSLLELGVFKDKTVFNSCMKLILKLPFGCWFIICASMILIVLYVPFIAITYSTKAPEEG